MNRISNREIGVFFARLSTFWAMLKVILSGNKVSFFALIRWLSSEDDQEKTRLTALRGAVDVLVAHFTRVKLAKTFSLSRQELLDLRRGLRNVQIEMASLQFDVFPPTPDQALSLNMQFEMTADDRLFLIDGGIRWEVVLRKNLRDESSREVRLAPLSLAHFFERNPEYIPEEMLRCDGVFEFAGTRLKRTDICWGAPISIIGAVETLDSGAHVLNFDTKHCPAPGKISGAEKRSWLVVLVASEPKPDEE